MLLCYRNVNFKKISTIMQWRVFYKVKLNNVLSCKNYLAFSTTVPFKFRSFIQSENLFAHGVMEKNLKYSDTIYNSEIHGNIKSVLPVAEPLSFILNKNWDNESLQNIFDTFILLSQSCSTHSKLLSDSVFNGLCNSVAKNCPQFTDNQLADLLFYLSCWPETESVVSNNFVTVWKALDSECAMRVHCWNIKQLLLFCDLWYLNNLAGISLCVKKSLLQLCKKVTLLSPQQLVQCLFYFNLNRKLRLDADSRNFVHCLSRCIHNLTVDEIAIICMGFFKTQQRIYNSYIMSIIIKKAVDNINVIHEISLCSISKFIYYCLPPDMEDNLLPLFNGAVPNIDRLSMLSCIHLALVSAKCRILQRDMLDNISRRFVNEIEILRIKDIERMALVLSTFCYSPNCETDIYEKIIQEIYKRLKEKERKYPRCVPLCLLFLTINNIFIEDLLSYVLSSQFLLDTYGTSLRNVDVAILTLDVTAELEHPEYKGNRLSTKTRAYIASSIPRQLSEMVTNHFTACQPMLLELLEVCRSMFGRENVCACHILPHLSKADIVFGVRNGHEYLRIPNSLTQGQDGLVTYAPKGKDEKWYVLVVGAQNCYIKNTEEPVGDVISKMRQLGCAGYVPVLIPWFEWVCLPVAEKKEYIKKKVLNQDIKDSVKPKVREKLKERNEIC